MGMFDYVNYSCICPRCNGFIDSFQSKDGPCTLSNIEVSQVNEFYGECDDCGHYTKFKRKKAYSPVGLPSIGEVEDLLRKYRDCGLAHSADVLRIDKILRQLDVQQVGDEFEVVES